MIVKIKNNTASIKKWCGQEISPGEYYTLEDFEKENWANNIVFVAAINNGEAIFNKDGVDLNIENAIINIDLMLKKEAENILFDNTSFAASNVKEAILELELKAKTMTGFSFSCSYNGNANTGKWLDLNNTNSSNDTPFLIPNNCVLRYITLLCDKNTTASIGLYSDTINNPTLITNISVEDNYKTKQIYSIQFNTLDEIGFKVISGSIKKPILYAFFEFI